jgi:CheY-like chemotaxis protein
MLPSHISPRNLKLLVIDGNHHWRSMLRDILEQELRITPALAHSGKKALELLEADSFDVVTLDLSMPEMDGVQLLRLIHQQFPELKIIVICVSYDGTGLTPKVLLERGAFAVISKIEVITKLVDILRAL